ncbi:phosphoribosylanthranilate isomerase [Peribacillus sp. SCS-155]|uniref:phosphoribosylanthranilate isomerase n=1 Tax=Peribacillus sedimenti TaxID=3115297 RepID=UPI0039066058
MIVKICGITTSEAAQAAVSAGADIIGFVFAESKRRIDPEKAASIKSAIGGKVKVAGVFVNEEPAEINRIHGIVGLDYIQLHGEETQEYMDQMPSPVIKAFGVDSKERLLEAAAFSPDYYLFDSPKGKYRGGNGLSFDLSLMDGSAIPNNRVILAGGLTPENVREAIERVNPAGVDVSSGVETDGKKDIAKIHAFIKNAKQTY